MAVETNISDEEEKVAESFEWTAENEVHLFNALKNRRPVGINRNFQMVFISETFNNLTSRDIPSSVLWDHLSELYDMDTLNDDDSPASSVVDEKDFALSTDFDDLLQEKVSGQSEAVAIPSTGSKATSLLKPAANSTPKQSSKSKTDSSRKESRAVKEDDGKADDAAQKSVKKKSRPSESSSKGTQNSSSGGTSSKKRRN